MKLLPMIMLVEGLVLAGGCATVPGAPDVVTGPGLQCAVYARLHSPVKLYGDAHEWWARAEGRFARGSRPQIDAVVVLAGYAGPQRAHLAIVRAIVSAREMRVDHANWFNDGAIYLSNPVRDVSAQNDWSQVRVWNMRLGAWGSRTYAVQGFIGPGSEQIAQALP